VILMKDIRLKHSCELNTPVLFLVFNRPDTTRSVFEAIRQAKPKKLYIAADGPRKDNETDIKKIEEVRDIVKDVNWDCEIKTILREKNLGCKIAISSAIDWFFENEEEGIILEDDCLPSQSFFWFCQELLKTYREDQRIFMISGDNFQNGKKRTSYSYYFSRYPHIWGWASWRRAWKNYDVNMEVWPEIQKGNWLNDILGNKSNCRYWTKVFNSVYEGKIDTWDYQLVFACWVQSSLAILPNINLVSNIGFGNDATHTKVQSDLVKLDSFNINFPLSHPSFVLRDSIADNRTELNFFSNSYSIIKAITKFRKIAHILPD
jgi:hypothetical protein